MNNPPSFSHFLAFFLIVLSFLLLAVIALFGYLQSHIPETVSIISASAIFLSELFFFYNYRSTPHDSFHTTLYGSIRKAYDYRLIGICLICTYAITFVLIRLEILITSSLPPSDHFWQAHVEFFITFGVSLAIIGAVYSLLSKQRADDVFDKSEEIYKAITSFITSYEQLLDDDQKNYRSIPNVMKKSKKSLTLFLGSPMVGYFRDIKIGDKFFRNLRDKLADMESNSNFKVELLCWSEEHSKQYYEYVNDEGSEFENHYDSLKIQMRKLATQNEKNKLYNWINGSDPGYRFIISDDKEVIYWVLVDASSEQVKEEKEGNKIKVGGFYSERKEMVDIFQEIFDKTKRSDSNKVEQINSMM